MVTPKTWKRDGENKLHVHSHVVRRKYVAQHIPDKSCVHNKLMFEGARSKW
jgi:hypothetical protein